MSGGAWLKWSVMVAATWTWGCGATSHGQTSAAGGVGAGGSATGAGSAAGGGSGQAAMSSCPVTPSPLVGASATLELETEIFFEAQALSPAQPNTLEGGSVLTPLNLRFYVSHAALLRADGSSAPADLVDASGAVKPYGLQLVSTDDESSLSLRLLGPPGSYVGISFTFGLDDSCNSGSFERQAPLSATSGMVWPPPLGYLFFRYEGMFTAGPNETRKLPGAIHMGGLIGSLPAPTVTAPGALTIANEAATRRRLRLALDQVFAAALNPTDLGGFTGPPGDEVVAGERLRRAASGLPLFVLVEP